MGRGYKFSRDLLLMRKSIDTLANQVRGRARARVRVRVRVHGGIPNPNRTPNPNPNQGRYDEAHVLKTKADQLERWERMKVNPNPNPNP